MSTLSILTKRAIQNASPLARGRAIGLSGVFPTYSRQFPTRTFSSSSSKLVAAKVKLTADTYHISRDDRFARVTTDHVKFFQALLGAETSLVNGVSGSATDTDLASYNVDWMRKYAGQSKLVLRPSTTEQVSEILAYCNKHTLAVVPQGGNTGLVGGSVPVHDEIVIALGRMNKITSFDPVSGVLVAEAGVILEVADQYLAEKGFVFPLDLGAKGSCQLGGNVATNAGGLRLLRYGSLHGNVLGLEAVLPDGRIVEDMCVLRKNNTGYDLKQLFIGSEGTLGIITAVSVLCPPRPRATNVAFLALSSYENAQKTFSEARKYLSEILTAFEMMDGQSQRLLGQVTGERGTDGGELGEHPFYCLIETGGSNEDHDGEKLASFVEHVMEQEIVVDGTVAQDVSQATRLWGLRERIPECVGHWGGVYKYDVSIPLDSMYELVEATRVRLREAGLYSEPGADGIGSGDNAGKPVAEVIGYGHMGDSNLHLNVGVREYREDVAKALEPWVYEWVSSKGGSISAEHGLGLQKKPYIGYSRTPGMIEMMKDLRKFYDPNGIMNPYKYI